MTATFPVGSLINTDILTIHHFYFIQKRYYQQYWKLYIWFLSDLFTTLSVFSLTYHCASFSDSDTLVFSNVSDQKGFTSVWSSLSGSHWHGNSLCWKGTSCYCLGNREIHQLRYGQKLSIKKYSQLRMKTNLKYRHLPCNGHSEFCPSKKQCLPLR